MIRKRLAIIFTLLALVGGVLTSLVLAQANNPEQESAEIVARGTILSLENRVTVWMYGTHLLKGRTFYALKSDKVDLDSYEGENVVVVGRLIHEGVDRGPPYLDVQSVEGENYG